MIPFSIAGVQMPVPVDANNVDAMLHRLDVTIARFPWVQMVLFSELSQFGPLIHNAQPLGNPSEVRFQQAAARYGIWLLPGSYFEKAANGLIYNCAPVIAPDGSVIARYRKMFPFLPYEQNVEPGTEFCVFDVPGVGRFGLSICYDIWFPETTRTLTSMGAEVLLHPVLTGTVDRDAELAIARATAAQFQCFVFDVNGLEAGGIGKSCVVDSSGTILHQAGGSEEIIPFEINIEQVRRQREIGMRGLGQNLKSWRDRKVNFDVYLPENRQSAYLNTLGPLTIPQRGSISNTTTDFTSIALAPPPK